jgi:hypothetical protein
MFEIVINGITALVVLVSYIVLTVRLIRAHKTLRLCDYACSEETSLDTRVEADAHDVLLELPVSPANALAKD